MTENNRFTKKQTLGNTGMNVSRIGLGAWAIGGQAYGELGRRQAEDTVRAYFECGGNFVDTARMYDESEAVIGSVVREMGNREQVFLCSKSMSGGSKEEIPAFKLDIETSLKTMGTDYIDLYYLHNPPVEQDDILRMLDVLCEYKQRGLIRAIGASIKGVNVTDQTVELCDAYLATGQIDVLMLAYSIFRQKNASVFKKCREQGIGVVARSVLESGFLTGVYEQGHVFSQTDHRNRWSREALDEMFAQARELQRTAVRPPFENLPQVAIQFALDEPGVSCAIIGATSPSDVYRNTALDALPPLPKDVTAMLKARYAGKTERYNAGMWNYGKYTQTGVK